MLCASCPSLTGEFAQRALPALSCGLRVLSSPPSRPGRRTGIAADSCLGNLTQRTRKVSQRTPKENDSKYNSNRKQQQERTPTTTRQSLSSSGVPLADGLGAPARPARDDVKIVRFSVSITPTSPPEHPRLSSRAGIATLHSEGVERSRCGPFERCSRS